MSFKDDNLVSPTTVESDLSPTKTRATENGVKPVYSHLNQSEDREHYPREEIKEDDTFSLGLPGAYKDWVKLPMQKVNWLSRAFFLWITPLVRQGYKATLNMEDLFPLGTSMTSSFIIQKFQERWQKELEQVRMGMGLRSAEVICIQLLEKLL